MEVEEEEILYYYEDLCDEVEIYVPRDCCL
jgi:hypothetical protein